jgi:hypothetical protein
MVDRSSPQLRSGLRPSSLRSTRERKAHHARLSRTEVNSAGAQEFEVPTSEAEVIAAPVVV